MEGSCGAHVIMAQPSSQPPLRDGALVNPDGETLTADVVIIGSGMGGGTLAWALRNFRSTSWWSSGATSCLENPRTPSRPRCSSASVTPPPPALVRRIDRQAVPARRLLLGGWQHQALRGLPAPIPAERLRGDQPSRRSLGAPGRSAMTISSRSTDRAERLYEVHGAVGEDPTEPEHSTPYPFPPLEP